MAYQTQLIRKVGRAVHEFDMIRAGDSIAVGVSGGKDSLALLGALQALQKRAPVPFDLQAFTIEQGKFVRPIEPLGEYMEQIGVALTEIAVNGKTYPMSSGTFVQSAKKTVTKDAQKVGIGAGIGAAIGAIAGGGDGAAKGAGIGAGAGTAAVLGTRGDAAVIPAESVITFTLSESITVEAD